MTPTDQTILHTEAQNGNCLRACLASVLEIDIDSMPHFEDMGPDWFIRLRAWMRETRNQTINVYHHTMPPPGYALAAGTSPRGIYHCVVCLGGAIVHDPHPSRAGLVEIERYWAIEPLAPDSLADD